VLLVLIRPVRTASAALVRLWTPEANTPRVLDQLGPRAAEQVLEFRDGWDLPLRPHRPLLGGAALVLRAPIPFGHHSRFA